MGGSPKPKPHSHQTSSSHDGDHGQGDERHSHPFKEGFVVEVRTDEPDFKDTFFPATVISSALISPKKKSKKNFKGLSVEYHTLFVDENGSELLKETLDISYVRPSLLFQEVVEGFEPGDAVDALYQGGWWIGVVERVVEGEERRYVVTFSNPPDEREFGFSELRVHWDWVDGRWVRPDRPSLAGLMFDVGRKVEVSFDREDGLEAWFPATILQGLGNGDYLVEYCKSNTEKKVETVKEKVDSLHLRPWPPLLRDKQFILLEKVDAFYDLSYWTGIIRQVLENSRYVVFFRQLKTTVEFNQSELRAHMDWKDGKWFTSSQDVPIPNSEGVMREYINASVPVKNLGDGKDTFDERTSSSLTSVNDPSKQLTPDFHKMYHVKSLRKRRNLSDSQNVISHSPKKLNKGTVLGSNQQKTRDRTIKGMCSESISPSFGNNVETTGATGAQSTDSPSREMRTRRKQSNVGDKMNSKSSYIKNISAQKSQVENLELDVGGKDPEIVDKTFENFQNTKAIGTPLIIGLPCLEMVSPGSGKSKGKRSRSSNSTTPPSIASEEKQHLHDSTIHKIEDMNLIEFGEFSDKRKRGRPRKTPTESIQTPVTDYLNKKGDDPNEIPEVDAINIGISSPIQKKTTSIKEKPTCSLSEPKDGKGIMAKKRISLRKHEDKVVQESTMSEENHVSNRGRRQIIISEKSALQVQDSLDPNGEKLSTTEVNDVVSETPNIEFENQPLSKWFEGMHSLSPVHGSRLPAVIAVELRIQNGDKQKNCTVLEKVVSEKHQERETQSLPFVKNTVLWKTIESMEVFKKIPQNPHFQPLEKVKESMREGKAIGLMVNFSSVVEKAWKLKFGDPKCVYDDILETLAQFEKHGFDVRGVKYRVVELLAVKDKEEKLVEEVKALNDKIIEHEVEKRKIEVEMDEISEQIRELQEKLSVVESAKVKKEDEIASLAIRMKETEQGIKNVRCEFEGIVSSELCLVGK